MIQKNTDLTWVWDIGPALRKDQQLEVELTFLYLLTQIQNLSPKFNQ